MARNHLSLKQIGATLGLTPNDRGQYPHAGQAWEPAIEKVARMFVAYPNETLKVIIEKSEELRTPMEPPELDLRVRMHEGRANLAEVRGNGL
jgi:hypothetical protein